MDRSSLARGPWKALVGFLQAVAPLLVRLVIGYGFVQAGWGKWQNFDRTAAFFGDLGIPAPAANAAFIATLELVGGACLAIGLGTRVAALLLSATMVVAILTAERHAFLDALSGRGEQSLTDVVPFAYLMFLMLLAAFGPGALSVDRFAFSKAPAARVSGP